jgi:hypothetical protein
LWHDLCPVEPHSGLKPVPQQVVLLELEQDEVQAEQNDEWQ